ncbi:hypothetical protein BCR34DRAFT_600736 [Clohesyomyces aquaticus]|uniref:Uncharacterized protein n=1 Tax=Clohesyomyces aquaticus TaxID=1231657 RepID=A0A1Y1ZQ50_9PLEO|nr:hypothetical protein BCR34DRAFT_600736 [Clohesyomyces aquaticus]
MKISLQLLILPILAGLVASQRRKVNHTMYLTWCDPGPHSNNTRLDVAIYRYGSQEYSLQKPWMLGSGWTSRGLELEWYTTSINGGNWMAYPRLIAGAENMKVGERTGTAEWYDEVYECQRDDGRLLYEDTIEEYWSHDPTDKYRCYSHHFCPFSHINETEGR